MCETETQYWPLVKDIALPLATTFIAAGLAFGVARWVHYKEESFTIEKAKLDAVNSWFFVPMPPSNNYL